MKHENIENIATIIALIITLPIMVIELICIAIGHLKARMRG